MVLAACSARTTSVSSAHEAATVEPVSAAGPQDCLTYLDQTRAKYEASAFFGFGEGSTPDDAVNLASADLVRQIQTRVSSSGVSRESNRDVEFTSLTQSTVDAMLTGMDVARRCREGFRWQAVTRLEKAVFFKNIQVRVQPIIKEAAALVATMESRTVSPQDSLGAATRARAMIRNDFIQARDLLAVCRTLGSCAMTDDAAFAALEPAASAVFARYAFALRPKDDEAAAVAGVVSRLLSEEGFAISSANDTAGEAGLSCQRKDFPPMANTGYMVTEVICGVTFSTSAREAVAGLTRTFRGNGLGENRQEALSEARRKLARKDNGT